MENRDNRKRVLSQQKRESRDLLAYSYACTSRVGHRHDQDPICIAPLSRDETAHSLLFFNVYTAASVSLAPFPAPRPLLLPSRPLTLYIQ